MTSTESRYLRACRRQPVDTTPVWFMRQAGRALPEYRAIRRRASLEVCIADPALAAEITLLPVARLGVDAAIVFADITTPLAGLGVAVRLVEGVGPVVEQPVRSADDLDRLAGAVDPGAFEPTAAAIRLTRRSCPVPIIGFAGAPFTLACYLVEGAGARAEFPNLRWLMRREPATVERLLDRLVDLAVGSLRAQVEAGAAAVQLFDSWVGGLSPADYRRFVRPPMRRLLDELGVLGVPVTVFGTGTAGLLGEIAATGGDVIGLDWRIELDDGWQRVGEDRAVQGNLDPWLLLGPWSEIEAETRAILAAAAGRQGHIFNLGHGVHPATDADVLRRLVDLVHEAGRRGEPASAAIAVPSSDEPPRRTTTRAGEATSHRLEALEVRGKTMSERTPTNPTPSPALLPYRHACPADGDPFNPRLHGGGAGDGASDGVGILLMAYGGPSSLDEVPAYYTDIRGGRPPSRELLDELLERYGAIGGRSPLADITERQRRALEDELARRELALPVFVGYKHSSPFVAETAARMAEEGVRRILAIALAPHFSTMTACSYCQRVDAARRALPGRDGGPAFTYVMVGDWHAEPAFLDALADVTRSALAVAGAEVGGKNGAGEGGDEVGDDRPWVVFSAHSLPERILGLGDPYPDLLRQTARLVAERLGLSSWSFAFQSAGRTADAWLGPDLFAELERLATAGVRTVVVSSVGFVSSNLELLYDIDIEARARAEELGMTLVRAAALDDHPLLVAALADIVERGLRGGERPPLVRRLAGAE